MLKKIAVVAALVALLAVVFSFSVGLAGASEKDSILEGLYQEMEQLRQQIVERRVEIGELTPEQGQQILERNWQDHPCQGGGSGGGWPMHGSGFNGRSMMQPGGSNL